MVTARTAAGGLKKESAAGVALTLSAALCACSSHKPPPAAPPVVTVKVVTLTPQSVSVTTDLPGRTVPYRVAEIRPQVSGIILKRSFIEGTDVKEGQQVSPEANIAISIANVLALLELASAIREHGEVTADS